jgi:UDPglucose 6-dehydrogenase
LEAIGVRLACNPEFLREGFAVRDSLAPDRIVFGVRPSDGASVKTLEEIYAGVDDSVPRMTTDYATAEMIKVAANAFLAPKISFINAMAEFAEAVDADVVQLAVALGHDPRIGHRFLKSGLGFGGGCLPKDIRGFMASAEEIGVGESLAFLREVDAINLRRRERVVQLTIDACGGDVRGRRVAILGLAFKPDSDDVRDSPALHVADALSALGADVVATDPHARATAGAMSPHLTIVAKPLDAIDGADVVLVLTDWSEYSGIDPVVAARRVATPIVIDARNCLDPVRWRDGGWRYLALGRPDGAL